MLRTRDSHISKAREKTVHIYAHTERFRVQQGKLEKR